MIAKASDAIPEIGDAYVGAVVSLCAFVSASQSYGWLARLLGWLFLSLRYLRQLANLMDG